MKLKRIVCILLAAALLAGGLAAGGLAVRKLYSMYKNIWNKLDSISYSVEYLYEAGRDLSKIAEKVDQLHRDAFFTGNHADNSFDYDWMKSVPPYIAHACGGIDGKTYTNSKDAFLLNYANGHRVFEVDFNLSNDGVLIAAHNEHDWRQMTNSDLPYTSENFNQTLLHDQYESLNCAEVIELMAEYPDIYIVTDTKDQSQEKAMLAFSQLVYCAKQTHPQVLDRIIPQIYNEEMLSWISSIYPFKSVIFTLYATSWSPESVLNFCMNSGVRFITMPAAKVSADTLCLWDTIGIHVAAHTINDMQKIEELRQMGVDIIYTDFVLPD